MQYYYVYIMANEYNNVLYIGFTNNLERRVSEHKQGIFGSSFTKKYNVKKLVYYEVTTDPLSGIEREKQLKRWRKEKKVQLIEQSNPYWKELAVFD